MRRDINRIVNRYVRRCGSRNPFDIAEYLNIQIQTGPLGSRCGCYMYLKKHRCILLNESLPEDERILVMAHELGHAILHRKQNCYFIRNHTLLLDSKIEKEANLFAADLIISDELFTEARECNYTEGQLARLAHCCKRLVRLRLEQEAEL